VVTIETDHIKLQGGLVQPFPEEEELGFQVRILELELFLNQIRRAFARGCVAAEAQGVALGATPRQHPLLRYTFPALPLGDLNLLRQVRLLFVLPWPLFLALLIVLLLLLLLLSLLSRVCRLI